MYLVLSVIISVLSSSLWVWNLWPHKCCWICFWCQNWWWWWCGSGS